MTTIDKTTTYLRVQQFHEIFGHPTEKTPTVSTKKTRELRVALIAEELAELCEALGVSLKLEYDTATNSTLTYIKAEKSEDQVDLVGVADALGDLDYVVNGGFHAFGIPHTEVLDEIHGSNMSKLGEDGLPIYNENGKVKKGPNFYEPNLAKIISEKI